MRKRKTQQMELMILWTKQLWNPPWVFVSGMCFFIYTKTSSVSSQIGGVVTTILPIVDQRNEEFVVSFFFFFLVWFGVWWWGLRERERDREIWWGFWTYIGKLTWYLPKYENRWSFQEENRFWRWSLSLPGLCFKFIFRQILWRLFMQFMIYLN